MSIGETELYYPKNLYRKEQVNKELNKMGIKSEYCKIEENKKNFIAKFKPPKLKILKEFRKL